MDNSRFKFRFWNKASKKMETFNKSPLTLGGLLSGKNDDIIVMQCTGLKDENKTLIYEGDIVQILGDGIPYVIAFEQNRAMFIIYSDLVCCNFDNYSSDDLYVIGNIYENPELLETR